MKDNLNQLQKELRAAGATPVEIRELSSIASRLGALKASGSHARDPRILWAKLLKPIALSLGSLVAGVLLVVVSQSVLPGNVLYPVQKLSDDVAVSLHPSYRADVMMKRAWQVNELVKDGADDKQVLATLSDYNQVAIQYKMMSHADYAAFELCKTELGQAVQSATPSVRRVIEASLNSLETS